ncbi:MAG: TetR/AcrR family transcriptional regulator [Alphaproteobacteria bacterium]|nr:TetR/AcrR family transcriptional regulator [Alphaproteobacteria bacterium]MBL6939968.1 TetR/AcrR family transcriptional regulator [Alphaproteobacteria bacterium]MBL7098176.1 TetR/AcrR family transcriptional regulator [Alphaproteobacteria bacterium]
MPRTTGDTRERLIDASAREFRAHGYAGTDTNRIAARAGFAPQTFYRHFKDKLEIFLAVYRRWEDEEAAVVASLVERRAGARALADAIVAHHRAYLLFRRSLRQLSVENPQVRKARAQSRLRQLENTVALTGRGTIAALAPRLFQIERLSDAIAEGEFIDLGVDEAAGLEALAALLSELRLPRG